MMDLGWRRSLHLNRVMLVVGIFDLMLSVPVYLTIVLMIGALDVGLLAILMLLRFTVSASHLYALLGPARRVRSGLSELDDEQLCAVDRALHAAPRRFIFGYMLTWALSMVLGLSLAALGIPSDFVVAHGELLTAGIVASTIVVINPAMLSPVLRELLNRPQLMLGCELMARKLSSVRPSASFGVRLQTNTASTVFAALAGFGAVGIMMRVDSARWRSQAELERLVNVVAKQSAAAIAARADVEVVESEALPLALGSPPPASLESLSAFDPQAERVIAAAPLGEEHWVVAQTRPDEQLLLTTGVLLLLVATVLLVVGLATRAVGKSLTDPLAELGDMARRMVELGELRALERLVPRREDEVGILVVNFNDMLDMLEELAEAAQAVASGDLRASLDRPGELHDAFRGMLEQLHQMVEELRITALEVSTAATEIHATADNQVDAVTQQSASVAQVSATLVSLARSAEDISSTAAEVLGNAEQTLATTDTVVIKISELSSQTSGISQLLEVIREVAERSDLLALNGSLEATRAGEAGRGFALVAGEMRRLAERVTGSVADVRERVAGIGSSSGAAVAATERSRVLAEGTANAARQISTVTHSQSRQTEEVSSAIQDMAQVVDATALASEQTKTAASGLQAKVTRLDQLIQQFKLHEHDPGSRE